MTDQKKHAATDDASRDGSAEQRVEDNDAPQRKSDRTMAGQEATKGKLPAEHDREHQSNYGGGGANGGA
jgi:hypothetical protein